jgi:hypothetical protein
VAPELAARVGWATQSDALLYVNVKGAVTTPGRRAATILAVVFIVVIVAAIIVLASKSRGGSGPSTLGQGTRAQPLGRASAPSGGWHAASAAPARAVPAAAPRWRGGGVAPAVPRGARVYRGGGGPGIGLAVIVPLDEPVYTHDGSVGYDDPIFAGDELYVSMTLVSTYDGRVLWHARDNLDLAADRPPDVDRMVHTFLDTLPPALPHAPSPAASPAPGPSSPAASPAPGPQGR